ncbi:WxcM-like domain-containing protein [uncultured Roseobacter sp.]|uniref:WxcM-like domain-containing protein n=1 Tax=uncultured Roseobacter sp. TaxID=114847 RepID=UPI00345D1CAD
MSGNLELFLKSGSSERRFTLNRSYCSFWLRSMMWQYPGDLSARVDCMVLESEAYERMTKSKTGINTLPLPELFQ